MGQPEFVMRLLDRAHGSLTFGEIVQKANDSRTAVQKTLSYLHKEHRIARVQDNDGIMHYNLTPHGKQWLTKADEQRNGSGEKKIKYEPPKEASLVIDEVVGISMAEASDLAHKLSQRKVVDVTEAHAKDTPGIVDRVVNEVFDPSALVRQAEISSYNKGFTQGFNAGYKQAAREAYEAGQRSVMKKLEVLLCGA